MTSFGITNFVLTIGEIAGEDRGGASRIFNILTLAAKEAAKNGAPGPAVYG